MNETMKIPNHLAIILDGNGRWAQAKGLVRTLGHQEGAMTLKTIAGDAFDMGVKCLSVYCFSTENWKRETYEVNFIFDLACKYFKKYTESFLKRDTKVIFSGDISKIPSAAYQACLDLKEATKNCKTHMFNFCMNYGSHDEILRATKLISKEVKDGLLKEEDINEEVFEKHLYSAELPPVDLLIRTSNEQRISNFMLWQISYAEIYFSKTLWPAFSKKDLEEAFIEYAKRDRRFGGVKK